MFKEFKRRVVSRLKRSNPRADQKIIFIHINKTGGSSVEKALGLRFEHKTALENIEKIGEEAWEKAFSFTVVRNPWDKVVSHYHYRIQTNQTDLKDKPIPFAEWVELAYGRQDSRYYDRPRMFMPQCDWVCDKQGRLLVDFVARFESLEQGFAEVCKRLKLDAQLPHLKQSKRGDYRQYYDEQSAQIVRDWFDKDIKQFGYSFE